MSPYTVRCHFYQMPLPASGLALKYFFPSRLTFQSALNRKYSATTIQGFVLKRKLLSTPGLLMCCKVGKGMPLLPSSLFFFSFSFHCEEKLRISSLLLQIFAKPFVGAMDGHIDAVSCMVKNPNYLKAIFSGSMDGGNYLLLC
jgi:hypothetical protein